MKTCLFSFLLCVTSLGTLSTAAPASAPLNSAEAKNIEALVTKAAVEINSKGSAAFTEFRQKGSAWFHDDTYLFVYDLNGVVLFNAALPQNEGRKNAGSARSPTNPQTFTDAFIETVKMNGSGWVDYMFAKPGQTEPVQKWSYVKGVMIDGVPGLVGAGFYPR